MINQKLLKPKVLKELLDGFRENNPRGVQVQGFMGAGHYKKFLRAVAKAQFKKAEARDTHSFFEARPAALKFFSDREFLSFASAVVGRKLTRVECSLRIFMAGCYTLMYDKAQKGVEFYFDLTPHWGPEWGGATFFITGNGEKLMLPPAPNNLVIAKAGRSYVKYVNHTAGKEGRLMVHGSLT
ncbi:MAG TPA: hypothetical protein VI934_00455 [Candidatus Nanoarchaeia archaeon]|nr:hypothetical protein [Candidatus Nanoarchaeia archaeon]